MGVMDFAHQMQEDMNLANAYCSPNPYSGGISQSMHLQSMSTATGSLGINGSSSATAIPQ